MEHSKHHLTIHLYRKDEALASIRWAILSRNHTEAVFWGLELYDSNMEQDAIQMLTFTWITGIGFGSWTCLESLSDKSIDRDEWCELISSWCRVSIHDTAAFYLLLRGASIGENWQPRFVHTNDYSDIHDVFEDALRRGKLLDAWLIARAIMYEVQWSLLEQMASEKGRGSAIETLRSSQLNELEQLAAAFVLVVLSDQQWTASQEALSSTIPIELRNAIDQWDSEDSLRKRRVFKVRPEAIAYISERSSQPVSESNEIDIQDNLEVNLVASSYWQEVLKRHMLTGFSESKRENFYDIFFSCDIPDEWSLADREKSHGRGLGKTDEQALKQFINSTFQRSKTLGMWKYDISSYSLPSLDWIKIYSELQGPCNESLNAQLPLKAIKRQFELL